MPLLPEQRYLTAMPTPLGTLQWRVLPMGENNGRGQFQHIMDWVLNRRRGKQDQMVCGRAFLIPSGAPTFTLMISSWALVDPRMACMSTTIKMFAVCWSASKTGLWCVD